MQQLARQIISAPDHHAQVNNILLGLISFAASYFNNDIVLSSASNLVGMQMEMHQQVPQHQYESAPTWTRSREKQRKLLCPYQHLHQHFHSHHHISTHLLSHQYHRILLLLLPHQYHLLHLLCPQQLSTMMRKRSMKLETGIALARECRRTAPQQ